MPGYTALKAWMASTKERQCRDLYTFSFREGLERWTSHASDVTVGANTWTANDRISSEELLAFQLEANGTDADELAIVLTLPSTATLGGVNFVRAADLGALNGIKVVVERYYPDAALAETLPMFTGYVEETKVNGTTIDLKIKTRQAQANNASPVIRIQAGCPYALGDSMCGVTLAAWTASRTAAAGCTTRSLVLSGAAEPNANVGAVISFTSGNNNGRSATVEGVAGTTLAIYPPLPIAPVAGNAFTVTKGCTKDLAGCGGFSNRARYIGFPYMPNPEVTS
jgi:uncharacterized phage protein (TIGR02218 family)